MAALTLARAYQHSFETRPNITLSLAGGSLNALGDCVAQIAETSVGTFVCAGNEMNLILGCLDRFGQTPEDNPQNQSMTFSGHFDFSSMEPLSVRRVAFPNIGWYSLVLHRSFPWTLECLPRIPLPSPDLEGSSAETKRRWGSCPAS